MTAAASIVDVLALLVVAVGVCGVISRGLAASVWLLVVQSALLALVATVIAAASGATHMWIAAGLTVVVRAVAIPAILFAVVRAIGRGRDVHPIVPIRIALVLAVGLVLAAFGVAGELALPSAIPAHDALPAALSLTFVGLLSMATRRLVVAQLIGLITMENGVFLAGLVATLGLPLFVEIGVFFDLLVAIAVTAVLVLRINEHFSSVSVDDLRGLRG